MNQPDLETVRGLRKVIEDYLVAHRDEKLEKLKPDDPKRDELFTQYECRIWLANAAKRVTWIQSATHTLKAMHPDARGSNLYCPPITLPDTGLVGSHLLEESYASDITGNAAALDVNKFLTQEFSGKTLLTWMQEDEAAVIAAFQFDDLASAQKWVEAFRGLIRSPEHHASHTLAKQLYWLVGDDPCEDAQFHLLAPLYASSFAHRVYMTIQDHRFGEESKDARESKKNNKFCEHVFHVYSHLAQQKIGGTKPQNISQLNSERKGINYLLSSCPPVWRSQNLKPPYGTASVFSRFERNPEVRALVRNLRTFLESNPALNQATRNRRDDLLFSILGEIRMLAEEYRTLSSGWSTDSHCRLAEAEQCWLDPERALQDVEFAETWQRLHWVDEIKRRFGNWLNAQLGEKLPLGDIEHEYWADLFDDEIWRHQIKSDQRIFEEEAKRV